MATVIELARRGRLEVFEPDLGFRQQAERILYARPEVWRWINKNLAGLPSEIESDISPAERLDDLLNLYCAGEPLMFDRQLKPLQHWGNGIWELKTFELRLFGWFYRKDMFLCCDIDAATKVKASGLYAGYRNQAVRMRTLLDLDPPKFIIGDDPNGVVTNVCFPKS